MELKISIAKLVVQCLILLAVLYHIGFFTAIYDRTYGHAKFQKLNKNWKRMLLQKISQFMDWCK